MLNKRVNGGRILAQTNWTLVTMTPLGNHVAGNENMHQLDCTAKGRISDSQSPKARGRVLFCRKCEGHGEKVILKDHAPTCPYILCTCKSCERLNQKRLKSFNKRNKEKLKLAAELGRQRNLERMEREGERKSSTCSTSNSSCFSSEMDSDANSSPTGLEGRSMSLGAMTVMSYDIWKAKCAEEKQRLEEEGKLPPPSQVPPAPRKRAQTFDLQNKKELPKVSPPDVKKKRGRYVVLPTIPAMRVFVDENISSPCDGNKVKSEVSSKCEVAIQAEPTADPVPLPAPVPVSTGLSPPFLPTSVIFQQPSPVTSDPVPSTSQLFAPPLSLPNLSPALSTLSPFKQPNPLNIIPSPFPATSNNLTTSAPLLTNEQLLQLLNPSLLLQNNLIQQQNAALQQLLNAASAPLLPSLPSMPNMAQLPNFPQPLPAAPIVPAKNTFSENLIEALIAQAAKQSMFS